jgi:hypothetical protein
MEIAEDGGSLGGMEKEAGGSTIERKRKELTRYEEEKERKDVDEQAGNP